MATTFFINLDTGKLQSSLTNQAEPDTPEFSAGDIPDLDVRFVRSGAYVDLTARNLFLGIGTRSNKPTQGQFYLTYSSVTTEDPLNYNATAAEVQDALEGLSTIGSGNVQVTGPDGGPWVVEFIEDLELTAASLISANAFTLLPLATVTVDRLQTGSASVNELQTIRLEQAPLTQNTSWTAGATPTFAFTGSIDLGTEPLQLALANKHEHILSMEVRTLSGLVPITRLRQAVRVFGSIGSGGAYGVATSNRGTTQITGSNTTVTVTNSNFASTGSVLVTPILSTGGIPSFSVTKATGSFTITVTSPPEIVSGDGKVFNFDYVITSMS